MIIVLLQQGKGADVGAVFGGSSQTVFGASGAGNVLTKVTWALPLLFFATSIFLAYASTRHITGSIFEGRVRHRKHGLAPQGQRASRTTGRPAAGPRPDSDVRTGGAAAPVRPACAEAGPASGCGVRTCRAALSAATNQSRALARPQ